MLQDLSQKIYKSTQFITSNVSFDYETCRLFKIQGLPYLHFHRVHFTKTHTDFAMKFSIGITNSRRSRSVIVRQAKERTQFYVLYSTSKIIISFHALSVTLNAWDTFTRPPPFHLSPAIPIHRPFSFSLHLSQSLATCVIFFFFLVQRRLCRESRDSRGKRARRCYRYVCASVSVRARLAECACARTRTRRRGCECVGERARACVRGGARVSVSHLTMYYASRASDRGNATGRSRKVRAEARGRRRKSRGRPRGFIARRSRRSAAQNRFILSVRSARRTR